MAIWFPSLHYVFAQQTMAYLATPNLPDQGTKPARPGHQTAQLAVNLSLTHSKPHTVYTCNAHVQYMH